MISKRSATWSVWSWVVKRTQIPGLMSPMDFSLRVGLQIHPHPRHLCALQYLKMSLFSCPWSHILINHTTPKTDCPWVHLISASYVRGFPANRFTKLSCCSNNERAVSQATDKSLSGSSPYTWSSKQENYKQHDTFELLIHLHWNGNWAGCVRYSNVRNRITSWHWVKNWQTCVSANDIAYCNVAISFWNLGLPLA